MAIEERPDMGDPKLVIFDCDGTLVDSQHVIIKAMRSAFGELGLQKPSDQAVRGIIGLSLDQAVSALAPATNGSDLSALGNAYKQAFIDQRKSPDFHEPLFDGAREILHELAGQDDILLGVATGKSRRGVDVLFEREGLADYFINIQTADDAPSKPHPGMIENAMNELGIDQGRVMMIGDTSFDIEMARNARVAAIGVRWGYHDDAKLQGAGAHHIIDSFTQITNLVATLNGSVDGT